MADGRPADATVATTADELLDRLAGAIADRVRGRRTAEEHLAAFAFREPPLPGAALPPSGDDMAADRSALDAPATDWRHFVRSALGALDDPDAVRILEALRNGGRSPDVLARILAPSAPDPVAAADRVARLAAAGLVGRDLETGRVALAPLGEDLLDLLSDVARRASEADR